jgi:proteasome lid subunit RPN8/RPN11
MNVTPEVVAGFQEAMASHAAEEFPKEACALVLWWPAGEGYFEYRRCANLAAAAGDAFVLDPAAWAAAEDAGAQVVAIVHSHPNASAHASMADRVMCERSGLPWIIIGWPSNVVTRIDPVGWHAPLIGRDFHHGVLDCYTLVRDYYLQELGIELPDFARRDGWWETPAQPGCNLYRDNFATAGFTLVEGKPQAHDVLLMRVAARVDNHAAIFIGDGTILHHLYGRLSCRDVWGDGWARHTTAVLRHRQLLEASR